MAVKITFIICATLVIISIIGAIKEHDRRQK